MYMLEIVGRCGKQAIGLLFCLALLIPMYANARDPCGSVVRDDLIECTSRGFNEADLLLNKRYADVMKQLTAQERPLLRTAEHAWLRFRKNTCQAAYDAVYPGREAPIDQFLCLASITRTRIAELDRLASGHDSRNFSHAVYVIADVYEHDEYKHVISKLSARTSDLDWQQYASSHCELTTRRKNDDDAQWCKARLNFYNYPP